MGSLVPFQDLNLLPESSMAVTTTTNTTTTTSTSTPQTITLKIPKIEPKTELLDEFYATHQTHQEPQTLFATSSPSALTNTQFTVFSEKENRTTPDTSQASSAISSDQDNVYSEFYRISELFRSAFAKRFQGYGGQDVEVVDPDSRAIVPVPEETNNGNNNNNNNNDNINNNNNDNNNNSSSSSNNNNNDIQAVSTTMVVPKRRIQPRSSELVRVSDLSVADQRCFRDVVRRTRMIYDSLRIYMVLQDEKTHGPGFGKRMRGDLRASSVMRDRGLWLNRDKRIVGSIPGVYIGDLFFFRMELCVVGLHGQAQAGIDYVPASQSSNGEPIATSVIVSGGYEDDEDAGDVIIYTGHGGQDKFSRQCVHQKLEGGNLALERSMHYGIEVRVIRGIKYQGSITSKVYVYDGLYKILDCWFDVGKSGFGVYKYKLLRIEGQGEMGSSILRFAETLRTSPLSVRPRGYLSLDISMKKENMPVMLFNDIDSDKEPMYYDYLVSTVFPPFAYHQSVNGTGCDCTLTCSDNCFCALKNGGQFAYDHNGMLLRGKPIVFECGPFCRCPPQCRNRVSQKGLRNRLEVFRSRETGWGVRPFDLIHAGAFICEYTGVVLTREQAQIVSMNGDNLIYPHRFSDRWAEWGDLSQIYSDYVRPSYPSVPPLDFAIDVSKMRNVACYISHSSAPNVMVQYVLYDHNNLMFPHLMLFAMENIPPLRELSLDYGVADEWTAKLSICN